MRKYYVIAINGQKAVDVARKMSSGCCYASLYHNGKQIAQVEVTVDDNGFYKGNPNKWVDVSFITHKNISKVLHELSRNGFKGCPALISKCKLNGCIEEAEEMCCFII